ncbi:MAG: PEGA domain-containing protein [Candidatus Omnitrophota bacterium]
MLNFQKIRSLLFYLSLSLFFAGLPFILSFALGYKFNPHTLKFTKTGLIFVKTQPDGAKVYLNGKLTAEKTPTSLHELVPGTYKIAIELKQHYPWKGEAYVEAGKACRLDKIILFPLRPNLLQLNQEKFSSFHIDFEKKFIYYLDQETNVVYRSNLEGGNFEDIASLPEKFTSIVGWQVADDKNKLFIFNQHQIVVVFFDNQADYGYADSAVFLDYPQEKIINVFWYADSYHLIVFTDKYIQIIESRTQAHPINLVKLNKEATVAFYDSKENLLYFSDNQKNINGRAYNNLYKLDLSSSPVLLEKLMKKDNE